MVLNPDWEFKIWTDSDNRDIVEQHSLDRNRPELLQLYDDYDTTIKRVDVARYVVLDRHGGLYMDMDMTCLRPFGNMFNDNDDHGESFTVATQYSETNIAKDPKKHTKQKYPNSFMVSKKNHPIFEIIYRLLPTVASEHVLQATGPHFLTTTVITKNTPNSSIQWRALPFDTIYAQQWNERNMCTSINNCRTRFPEAVTISFWTHSWNLRGGPDIRTWKEDKQEQEKETEE
jgi:mannosyltransferase OCH1-like enzyme